MRIDEASRPVSRRRWGTPTGAVRAASLAAAVVLIASPLAAQPSALTDALVPTFAIPSTEVRALHSAVNGVAYQLYVSKPPGYDTSTVRYPVVYLLDADYSFPIAHAVAWHLTERSHLPPVLVVAIAYGGPPAYRSNRTRDYTPVFVPTGGYGAEYQRVSGGAARFLEFIETELIPFVERSYRASSDRTLVGHSYGGLFSLWTALTEPELFRRVLAVSPSIWYDDQLLLRMEERQRAAGGRLPERLYMTAGDLENPVMAGDLRTLAAQLRARGDSSAHLHAEVLEGETHNSIFASGFSRGLRWLFADMGAR